MLVALPGLKLPSEGGGVDRRGFEPGFLNGLEDVIAPQPRRKPDPHAPTRPVILNIRSPGHTQEYRTLLNIGSALFQILMVVNRQALLDEILRVVLDPAIGDEQIGALLRNGVGMDRMRSAWEARRERLLRDHGHLAMLDASMAYLRQFVPDVLAAVRFADGPGAGELLEAVAVLAKLYATRTRKVSPGARPGSCRPDGPATWTPRRPRVMSRPASLGRPVADDELLVVPGAQAALRSVQAAIRAAGQRLLFPAALEYPGSVDGKASLPPSVGRPRWSHDGTVIDLQPDSLDWDQVGAVILSPAA